MNEDRDWLDESLATTNYVPDDGFTAGVLGRLPKRNPVPGGARGRSIFFLCTLLACCVFAVKVALLVPVLDHLSSQYSASEVIRELSTLMQQPPVIYGGVGCMVVAAFAAIPFLRRWV